MSRTPADPTEIEDGGRGILIGASGTGKSTLAAHLISSWRETHRHTRVLVLDTKPRWRASKQADGTSTRRLYRRFVRGDLIPESVCVGRPDDWSFSWDDDVNPGQAVIVQRLSGSHRSNVLFQTWCAEKFFESQSSDTPSLIYIDEGHDFFTGASAALGSDIVQRCFRAGRERNLATVIGVQRPKGVNLQCLTEASYCALFRINYVDDVKRLYEMGWPKQVGPPGYDQPHAFRLWRDTMPQTRLYRLTKG